MVRPQLLCALLAFGGCVGDAEFQVPGGPPVVSGEPPGERPVQVGTFEGRSQGLPSPTLDGTAQFNGALYAVSMGGLYRLVSGASGWEPVPEVANATSLVRIDTALWVTAADGPRGWLYRLSFGDDAFTAVPTAPDTPAFALLKKGPLLLLATRAGLKASSDRGATWTTRSTAAVFSGPVRLVASAAATRIFALTSGRLWHSDDAGASWSSGLINDEVTAIDAEAEVALVQTRSQGALRSDNYGNTFHALDLGATAQAFAAAERRAFAGTMSGLRVSDDSGLTWRDANAGLPQGEGVKQLFIAGATLVASTGQAVYVAQVK